MIQVVTTIGQPPLGVSWLIYLDTLCITPSPPPPLPGQLLFVPMLVIRLKQILPLLAAMPIVTPPHTYYSTALALY